MRQHPPDGSVFLLCCAAFNGGGRRPANLHQGFACHLVHPLQNDKVMLEKASIVSPCSLGAATGHPPVCSTLVPRVCQAGTSTNHSMQAQRHGGCVKTPSTISLNQPITSRQHHRNKYRAAPAAAEPPAALLYDFHDQLIPYDQVGEPILLLPHSNCQSAAVDHLFCYAGMVVAEAARGRAVCSSSRHGRRHARHRLPAAGWWWCRVWQQLLGGAELCRNSSVWQLLCTLQHPPVYTLGAGSSEEHVKFDLQQPPHPLYRTERGGEVTYHGPGQVTKVGSWRGQGGRLQRSDAAVGCVYEWVDPGR